MLVVDNRGLACPQPVINTRRVIEVNPEETVVALVDSLTSRDNLLVMAEGLGRTVEWEEEGTGFRVTIRPAAVRPAPGRRTGDQETPDRAVPGGCAQPAGPLVVVLSSDRLGQGDEVLGTLLMKSFLSSLIEVETPATLICLNRGVFLSTAGSPVLDLLQELASRGTEILSCGTCLDFYGREDELKAGRVGNMYTILERLTAAGRLIQW
ncbi:MAG: sulfurtransferase-like selenium metabolism protein YedF [Bacillota bacterium]|nr:sulfurtransferase-like selenium metabolism protein YedF [Bacillota bacterium]